MKEAVLMELIEKWRHEAKEPECADGSPEAAVGNAKRHGERCGLMRAADDLQKLIALLAV